MKGNLTSEPETQEFRNAVYTLLKKDVRKVVIDLGKVDYISSIGLGAIVAVLTSMKNRGGELRIANPTAKTGPLFMVTQLVKVLRLYETVDRAVSSFQEHS